MTNNGLFVTLEGIDAAGKTTVADAIDERFSDVVRTQEPAEQHWTGEATRRAIESDETPAMTDFYLFMADRAYHIEHTVRPALSAGNVVVCDRYIDSTYAYQQEVLGGAVEDPTAFIEYNLNHDWVLQPDITILLDISAAESARRQAAGDKYETSEFLSRVRNNYREHAADNPRIITVDAEQEPEQVIGEVMVILDEAATHQFSDDE